MTSNSSNLSHPVSVDTAEHVSQAREKARQVLGGESHLAAMDNWRYALLSARDAIIFIWLTWIALYSFGEPNYTAPFLLVICIGVSLLIGISTGRSAHTQVQYYARELERERTEIRDSFEQEREEVRVLYAAKGFSEPLLGQIVDTLCADEDRLLKVMMEEELGLFMHHVNHPLLVGALHFVAALIPGFLITVPLLMGLAGAEHDWFMPTIVSILLIMLACGFARSTGRGMVELVADFLVMAFVTGGVVYFLGRWLSQVV